MNAPDRLADQPADRTTLLMRQLVCTDKGRAEIRKLVAKAETKGWLTRWLWQEPKEEQ